MAIFQPKFIIPDLRSGLGLGVVDAAQPLTVSWRINGASALTAFSLSIFSNNAASTQIYTTGQLSDGCPAYGTSSAGEAQIFEYTIPASELASAGITNGNEYKLVITQWWGTSSSIVQSSASVFRTRATPLLSINPIGTQSTIDTRYYTFTGNYSQQQGDILNWFRWQIAYADNLNEPFFDTGDISGTMDISCYFDGFFDNSEYAVKLMVQTENGVEADTDWNTFAVSYGTAATTGTVRASYASGTDAILVEWSGIGYIPGTASGDYTISDDYVLSLPTGSTITWNKVSTLDMSFSPPWSFLWKGTIGNENSEIFRISQASGDITLSYNYLSGTLTLAKGNSTIAAKSGIINEPTLTVLLTSENLYIRFDGISGGLYPSSTLYPSQSLFPLQGAEAVTTDALSASYTQENITGVTLSGYQTSDYFEVAIGEAGTEIINQAIYSGSYEPGSLTDDYMMANWENGLSAGTLDVGGATLSGYALYRRESDSTVLTKVAETSVETTQVYDYGARSNAGVYTYYLFPVGSETYIAQALVSNIIRPCWFNYTLMDCETAENPNIFKVLTAYRFRLNIETAAMSNNNTPNILQNFTPFPKVQIAPQNYKSSTLTGLIGAVSYSAGEPEYLDTRELRDSLYALSLSTRPLLLKTRKGDLIRIKISAPLTMKTNDSTAGQIETMSLPWVEVASTQGISAYSAQYVGTESEGQTIPSYIVDTSNATANEDDIVYPETAYARGKMLTGTIIDGDEVAF